MSQRRRRPVQHRRHQQRDRHQLSPPFRQGQGAASRGIYRRAGRAYPAPLHEVELGSPPEHSTQGYFGAGGGGLTAIPATPFPGEPHSVGNFERHCSAARLDDLSTVCNPGDRSHDRRHRSACRIDHQSAYGGINRKVARTRPSSRCSRKPL
jgi:hypothetical protein